MGQKIRSNTDLVFQVHYPKGTVGQIDENTKIKIYYHENPSPREIFILPLIYHSTPILLNGPLFIPANQTKTFEASFIAPQNYSLLAVMPHMHLIGRSMTVWTEPPPFLSGNSNNLVRINNWDFNWQGAYTFKHPIKLQQGHAMRATAFYDNTSNNPNNPNNPIVDVDNGENTTDEMFIVFTVFTEHRNGDEAIDLEFRPDSLVSTNELLISKDKLELYPNPVNDKLTVKSEDIKEIYIHNILGQVVYQNLKFVDKEIIDLTNFKAGVYILKAQNSAGKIISRKIIRQ